MTNRFTRAILAMAAVVLAACGPAAPNGQIGPRGNPRLLVADEIQASRTSNVYEAVQRLRPSWLMLKEQGANRGLPAVFLGSQSIGDVDRLRDFEIANVHQVVYMDPPTAASRFGRNLPFGVIQIVLDVGG